MQIDEHRLDRAAGGGPTAERAAEAQRRALEALARMIPGDTDDGAHHEPPDADDEDGDTAPRHEIVIDLTDGATGHRWATAARAARLAGVPASTVRQWARHGVIRRERRKEGGYVVDVEGALDAATHAGPDGDVPKGHVLAKIMQLQRDRAIAEMQHIDREVEEAVVEIQFLRHQLEFAAAENRGLRVSLDRCRQELAAARTRGAVLPQGADDETEPSPPDDDLTPAPEPSKRRRRPGRP